MDGICSCYSGAGTPGTFWRPKGRCFSSWRLRCIREAWRAGPKPFAIAFPVFCTWPSGFETIPKTASLSNAKTVSPLFKSLQTHFITVVYIKYSGKYGLLKPCRENVSLYVPGNTFWMINSITMSLCDVLGDNDRGEAGGDSQAPSSRCLQCDRTCAVPYIIIYNNIHI